MANSKYEYVKMFERDEVLLPNTWIVVRIDGRGFHKLSNYYSFSKPNDDRALNLMNTAAVHTLKALPDINLAYGVSDEYSFVFDKATSLFERRRDKLVSTVVSTFTGAYVWNWERFFGIVRLDESRLPSFDGRSVCFPETGNLRDYLRWRQVDYVGHINNLYNTTFWTMVQRGGMTTTIAEAELKGTLASDKNEILWSRFGINYNNEAEKWKKGSLLCRDYGRQDVTGGGGDVVSKRDQVVVRKGVSSVNSDGMSAVPDLMSKTQAERAKKMKRRASILVMHVDIIKDDFWEERPWILERQ